MITIDKHVTLLLFLAGIVQAFDKAISNNQRDNFSLLGLIAFCIIMAAYLAG